MGSTAREWRALVVLGMHRSGTSLLMQLLESVGVQVGTNHLPPAADNQLGFYEKVDVVSADGRLLAAAGLAGWADPSPLPPRWWTRPECRAIRTELAAILRDDFESATLWAVKDPRLCRLMPLWLELLDELGVDARFVLLSRHPEETAASLARRDQMPAPAADLLWLRHVLESEEATRGRPRVFLTYEDLLADADAGLDRIADVLGLQWPADRPRGEGARQAVVRPDLRHHVRGDASGGSGETWMQSAYRALAAMIDGREGGPRRQLATIRRQLDAAGTLLAGVPAATPRNIDEAAPRRLLYAGFRRWDQGQLDASETTGEIFAERSVEIAFTPRHPNLCAVELLFGVYRRTNTSTVEIAIEQETGPDGYAEVHRCALAASELADSDWYSAQFVPQARSDTHRYRVRVSSPDAVPGDAVTLYCNAAGDPAFRAYYAHLDEAEAEPARGAGAPTGARTGDAVARLEGRVHRSEEALRRLEASVFAPDDPVRDLAGRVPGIEERLERLTAEAASYRALFDLVGRTPGIEERLEHLEAGAEQFPVLSARTARLEGDVGRVVEVQASEHMHREALDARLCAVEESLAAASGDLEQASALNRAALEALRTRADENSARLSEIEGSAASNLAAMESLRGELASLSASANTQSRDLRGLQVELEHRVQSLGLDVDDVGNRVESLKQRTANDLEAIRGSLEEAWDE